MDIRLGLIKQLNHVTAHKLFSALFSCHFLFLVGLLGLQDGSQLPVAYFRRECVSSVAIQRMSFGHRSLALTG